MNARFFRKTHVFRALWLAAGLAAVFSHAAQATQCFHARPEHRATIGLALGGGGARGYAHVGVLQLLEELRVPVDYIAGTSMGSIVGGLAATGMDAAEISAVIEGLDWTDLFSDETERQFLPARRKEDDVLGLYGPKIGVGKGSTFLPAGFVAGQKILFMFETVTSQRVQTTHFDQLPTPFRAVATDIVTGKMVVMDQGSLSGAMRASMSVPGAFDPVRVGDQLLVDGGLVRNLPVDVVRDMGADIVVAVDVGTPLMGVDEIKNVLSIVEQLSSLEIVRNTEAQVATLGNRDILISPKLGNEFTSASFLDFAKVAPLGYQVDADTRHALEALSLPENEYRAWKATIENCITGTPEIHFVRLNNESRFSDEVLRSLINVQPGGQLDTTQLNYDIRQIYGLGFIRLARYRVIEENGQLGIEIDVRQDERGTDFIETGLSITGGGRGTAISLQAGYLKTDLDERGSEARGVIQIGDDFGLLADVYKLLDDQQRYFLKPQFLFSRRDLLLFDDSGQARGTANVDEAGVSLSVGREFGRFAVIYAGVNRYLGTLDVTLGPALPSLHFDGGEWRAGLVFDRLDNLFLPRRGARIDIEYIHSDESIGADQDFEQLRISGVYSKTRGAHNALLTWRYNTTLDSNAPIYALFTGGGFLNMSGFEPAELSGQHFGVVGVGYRYQVGKSGFLPGYAGMTVEYGNAADRRSEVFSNAILNGSLYFAYDTPLGPVYLGYGWSEDRSGIFFLRLGAIFGTQSVGQR